MLIGGILCIGLFLTHFVDYLLFHSLVEIVTALVGFSIFALIWNARRFFSDGFFLSLGTALFFVAGIDMLHMLAYKGMSVFPWASSANLATQLWLAGRLISALSLVIAVFLIGRKAKAWMLFSVFAVAFAGLLLSIFFWKNFPAAYVDGVGLTDFKKNIECIVIGCYLFSLIGIFHRRQEFDPPIFRWTFAWILFTAVAEFVFTLYRAPDDGFNLGGHLIRLISYYFIYRAVIVVGFIHPYDLVFRNLEKNREELENERNRVRQYFEDAGFMMIVLDRTGALVSLNRQACRVLGVEEAEAIGKNWFDHFIPESVKKEIRSSFEKMIAGEIKLFHFYENPLLTRNGSERLIRWRHAALYDESGITIRGLLLSGEDISEQRAIEDILHLRTRELTALKTELERLRKLLTTRDLRLLALKDEVEELKVRPEEPQLPFPPTI